MASSGAAVLGQGPGGSALTKLRTTLKNAGLMGTPKGSRKKIAKAKAAGLSVGRRPQVVLDNPFERKVQRVKHEVLGRKVKGHEGKPSQSRSRAYQKRASTLLVEHRDRDRVSEFVDRRFGESDKSLTAEEKMIERFAKERQRRASRFSLEDGEELTHMGQSLATLDDDELGPVGSDADDDDAEGGRGRGGSLSADMVARANFGGFVRADDAEGEDDDGRPMTKREIMLDVIAKSKAHKRERQVQKEEIEDMREKVDADFDSVRHLLQGGKPAKRAAPADAAAAPAAAAAAADADGPYEKRRFIERREAPGDADEYDSMVRELAQEKKAKPTNRLKTAEELAREERLKLEALERDRLRRMHGEGVALGVGAAAGAGGGDDLDTNVLVQENPRKKAKPIAYKDGKLVQLPELGTRNLQAADADDDRDEGVDDDEEDEEEDDEGEEDDGEGEDEDDEGDEDEDEDDEEDDEEEDDDLDDLDEAPPATSSKGKSAKGPTAPAPKVPRQGRLDAMRELPFVLPVPASASAFAALVDGRPPAELAEAISRIRKCNHPGLATGNRERLQLFFDILLDYLATLGATTPTVPLAHVDAMIPALLELATEMPEWAAECCRTWLAGWEPALRHDLDERARLGKESAVGWPSAAVLVPLAVIAHLFPDTDRRHVVLTPLRVLLAEILGMAPVWTTRDAACGLFLATTALRLHARSRRFFPEALVFLDRALAFLVDQPTPKGTATDVAPIDFATWLAPLVAEAALPALFSAPATRWALLQLTMRLLSQFIDLHNGQTAVTVLVRPFTTTLARAAPQLKRWPASVKADLEALHGRLATVIAGADSKRYPCQLQRHKPVALKEYAPRFDETFNPGREHDPDEQRANAKKLARTYKQELKSAKRELRKDSAFLAEVQLKERLEKDQEYNAKIKSIYSSLEQEHAGMSLEEKRKLRKRR